MFFTVGHIAFYGLLLATAILLFYYIYFFARLSFYKPRNKSRHSQAPVSVIICAKDEARNLSGNIPAVAAQQYDGPLERLIVNDNSTDDSKYILQELNRKFNNLTVLELCNEAKLIAGKKYPLSMGIREAKHETLLLTDADCMPASEYWVQKMQEGYDEGIEIVLGYGAYQKFPGFLNKVIRFETFHSALQYLSYALAGQTYMGVGRNLSYKKSVFLRNKGFSAINHLPGGDDDLFINKAATKNNTAIVTDPDAHTLSEPKKTWKDWKRQKTRHFSTSKYYRPKHKMLLGLYSLAHFLFYPAVIASVIMFDWRITLLVLAVKSIVQYVVFSRAMNKLNETDLINEVFLLDLWMVFYYVFFAPMLFRKESKHW